MTEQSDAMQPVAVIAPAGWMTEAATGAVVAALSARGQTVRFVGGCVRDTLLGRPAKDVDVATPDPPDVVLALLAEAGIKAVPTGLAHGTVTAVVPPRHFEITTLRRDVETFGRHATVAFTDDWAADSARRDFTMNALFLDAAGRVFDPVGGLDDLKAGRVRFVGDAAMRIREDVLRLLRFYRFHAHYGQGAADAAGRSACAALADLLPGLSGERVAAELLRLLAAADPLAAVDMMIADGVLAVLLPEATRRDRLAGLVALEPAADPLRRLAALLTADASAAAAVAGRLKLSKAERGQLVRLAAPPVAVDLDGDAAAQRRALHRLGVADYGDLVLLRAAETGQGEAARRLIDAAPGEMPPPLPIRGADVTDLGIAAGPRVGALLAAVESWWAAADYRPDRAACLARLALLAGPPPIALCVMGVSGSGKSTIAVLLAKRLGWLFAEGDDLHPPANVEKMRQGIPLADVDRVPWLARIAALIAEWRAAGTPGVVTCSALKRAYRDTVVAGHDDVRFVYLRGSHALIADRLAHRSGHFMPPSLLDSQFATLEAPGPAENSVTVDIGPPPEEVVTAIVEALGPSVSESPDRS